MKHCSSCGRQIPESVAICSECEQWAADSVTGVADAPPEAVAVPSQPSVPPAQAGPPSAASKRGLGRRELLVILIAVAGGGLITLALLSMRGPSAAVAAAPVDAPARTPVSAPGAPPASVVHQKWNSENRADWVGNQRNAAAFELPAENTVPIWMNHVRPLLVVRCVAKSIQVFVWTGSALKMEAQSEDHTVTFRFDDEPAAHGAMVGLRRARRAVCSGRRGVRPPVDHRAAMQIRLYAAQRTPWWPLRGGRARRAHRRLRQGMRLEEEQLS